jgi:hypothetical protein
MADRKCDRCGAEFPYPWKLQRHLRRKTPCAPILDRDDLAPEALEDPNLDRKKCRFCGRVFSSYDSMRRHVRTACKIAPNARNGDAGMDLLYEHTIRRQEAENAELRAQLAALTQNVEALTHAMKQTAPVPVTATPGIVNHGSIENALVVQDQRVAVSNHVTINLFGRESVDHVTPEKIRGVLEESMQLPELPQAAMQAVLKAALLVYSDPDYPENLTCYLPNKRDGSALVHAQDGWEVRPLRIVAPPMAAKSVDLLFDKQPFEDAETFEPLMAELRDNEKRYAAGGEMRTILVRNKDLLTRALKELPVAGADA